jgi:predicted  nucleic acid-binding Zn-ribbon protein
MTTPESVYAELTEVRGKLSAEMEMTEALSRELAIAKEKNRLLEMELRMSRTRVAGLETTGADLLEKANEWEQRANALSIARNDAIRALKLTIDTLEQA